MPRDGRAAGHSARRAHALAPRHRPRRAEGPLPPPRRATTSPTSSAAASATCCSAAGRRISTSARRRIRIRSRSCSGTAGSSAAASASRTSSSARRSSRSRRSGGRCSRARRSCRTACRRTATPHRGDAEPRPTRRRRRSPTRMLHRDNTFGTPEEDAFRRDFTINALFYDIATFSIIDYVGGLEDLRAGIVRSIGDPEVRFREDPVRMLRAVALAARLDFTIDPPILDAIRALRHEIARSSPARLLEEYYKILRAGSAEKTFRGLADAGLLEPISQELHRGASDALWRSLAALDAYRAQVRVDARHAHQRDSARQPARAARPRAAAGPAAAAGAERRQAARGRSGRSSASCRSRGATSSGCARFSALQRRLRDLGASVARAARADASQHLPRSADLDGDPRRRAGARRALDHGARRARRRRTGRCRPRRAPPPAGAGDAGGAAAGDRTHGDVSQSHGCRDSVAGTDLTAARSTLAVLRCSKSRMNDTSASTPSSGNAL